MFFPNDIVFRYFDYPDIFPNLLSALNLMLAIKTRLTKVKITKRFQTEPLTGKVKEHCLHATAKISR